MHIFNKIVSISTTILVALIIFSAPVSASEITVFGEKSYVRVKGKAVTETDKFTPVFPDRAYTLKVTNGVDGYNAVNRAVIFLNGVKVLRGKHLNQNIGYFESKVTLVPGENSISVTLKRKKGSALSVAITATNSAPAIVSTPITVAKESEYYVYDIEVSDADVSDTFTYSLEQAPVGMRIDHFTGQITWTPSYEQSGLHPVVVKVSDFYGETDTQAFDLNVENNNRVPKINSTPELSAHMGESYRYKVTATDEDGDSLTYSLSESPSAMTIDSVTGEIRWIPQSAGDFSVNVMVDDNNGGVVYQKFSLKVAADDDTIVIRENYDHQRVSMLHNSHNVDIFQHDVVVNDSGQAIAYWVESTDTNSFDQTQVVTNIYQNGSWQGSQSIGFDGSIRPHLSQNASNEAMAVWVERTFEQGGIGRYEIWASHLVGGLWNEPVRISSSVPAPVDFTFVAWKPKVALADDGTAVAVWTLSNSETPEPESVYYSTFDKVNWSEPMRLSNGETGVNGVGLNIASNSSGQTIVTWPQNTNKWDPSKPGYQRSPNQWAAIYADGHWNVPARIGREELGTDFYGFVEYGQATINEHGEGMVVWTEHPLDATDNVFSRSFTIDGFESNIDLLATTENPNTLSHTQVTVDDAGDAVAVWRDDFIGQNPSEDTSYSYYDSNTGEWSSKQNYDENIDEVSDALSIELPVTTNNNGNFKMIWEVANGNVLFPAEIAIRQYDSGVGLDNKIVKIGQGREPMAAMNRQEDLFIVAIKRGYIRSPLMFTIELIAYKVPALP